ncbi:MAG: 4-alpha-glucanotransferase [Lachnospiraceae bacterium]|nr:4-alpha-glucanotransferase [Lachnospiraceae bacterium]
MRESGILLPVSSLPSRYGIGCFSKSAYEFVDQLVQAEQRCWQILPLGQTSYGDSPYQSFSTFAGNPYFISLEALVEEGVLTQEECDAADFGDDPRTVDYAKIYENRYPLLRKAYERSSIAQNPDFIRFQQENAYWLDDYALFMAVKKFFGDASWDKWPEDIRKHYGFAMDYYREKLYFDIEFYKYMQFKFMEQWMSLKSYANQKGIRIIGDIPIYVAFDSADTWAHPQLFQLDENNLPTAIAGCPPDGFAADGQVWGNPLYRWDYHRQTGYGWWMSRLAYCFRLYDVVRIDHFRGFDEYYSIPYGETTARNGHWEKGPGIELFNTMKRRLGDMEVIAEDLGYVTDSVRQLVKDSGFPGMKVLEFAFDSRDTGSASDYLPHNYTYNSVVYTGTHDNETLRGWYQSISDEERAMVRRYLHDDHTPDEELNWEIIYLVMSSVSRMCIIPMQDYFGYGNEARMNRPSTLGSNWKWRMLPGELTDELLARIEDVTALYGRKAWHKKDA